MPSFSSSLFILLLLACSRAGSASCVSPAKEYDFVIVGMGAAGSVLARRLHDQGYHVVGLEAGPPLQGVHGGDLIFGTTTAGQKLTVYDVPGFASIPPGTADMEWDLAAPHARLDALQFKA